MLELTDHNETFATKTLKLTNHIGSSTGTGVCYEMHDKAVQTYLQNDSGSIQKNRLLTWNPSAQMLRSYCILLG